jgi:hypothetical protein
LVARRDEEAKRRTISPFEWLGLVAGLTPFLVAVVRAAIRDWMPVGDAAYFTVRSRDVLTDHHPLLGAWSSGSAVVGEAVNNLGPLQLDLLAPFTKLAPYLGTAAGAAAINAASVVSVWFVIRRMFRPSIVLGVMLGTTLFTAALGLSWLIDARQQQAMVLPFYALLWSSAGMWTGVGLAVPVAVVAASLTIQSHFTYAYQSALVLLAGIAGYLFASWHRRELWRRVLIWSFVLGTLCWVQPVVDQITGSGNLGTAVGPARDRPGAGLTTGVQLVAGAALAPPLWSPASFSTFLLPNDGITLGGAVFAFAAWMALAVAVATLGIRRGVATARAAGIAVACALLAGLVAAAAIPVSMFGLVPQNYYWAWPLAAFASIALAAGALSLPTAAAALRIGTPAGRRVALAAVTLVAVCVAVWPRYPVASVALDEDEAERVGRPLRAQLAAAIDAGEISDQVEVDLSRAFFANDYPYVMLIELQRAGVEFHFTPDSRNLDRFGESRCAEGGRYERLLLISGREPQLTPGSKVVAAVAAITDDELVEYDRLSEQFGGLLRNGAISIDSAWLSKVATPPSVDRLRAVLATRDLPARGLARDLDSWRRWGIVSIPDSDRESFDRWFALEARSSADFQTIVTEQPSAADQSSC